MLVKHAVLLKWPLLRSLSQATNYRAFLGLPQTMEQTRRFLTTVSGKKSEEILVQNLDFAQISNPQDLIWVQDVLQFMTGDGRRKKDLGGFVLQDKGPVRAAINKARNREKQLQQESKAGKTVKPIEHSMERDIRIVDQERQEARAKDFGSLIDTALQKNTKGKR